LRAILDVVVQECSIITVHLSLDQPKIENDPSKKDCRIAVVAAWPMLAACITLYALRDLDTIGVTGLGK